MKSSSGPSPATIDFNEEKSPVLRPVKRRRLSDEEDDDIENPTRTALHSVSKKGRLSQQDYDDLNSHLNEPRSHEIISRITRRPPDAEELHAPPSKSIPVTDSTFESMSVAPWLVQSLALMEIKRPTGIQKSCIPPILKGRDCIGGSWTGTGKTVAFAVPILQKWAEDPFGIYAVILTPTRELALQIYEQFSALGAPQSLKTILVTGGSEMRPQAVALSSRPHIVVATPGRLADHIENSGEDTVQGLKRAKYVVFDEADRLLAGGPGSMLPDLEVCLSALPPTTKRHTLLFTATVTPEVRALENLPRPKNQPPIFVAEISAQHELQVPQNLLQTYVQVPFSHREGYLHVLLSTSVNSTSPAIIFCNRTKTADLLERIFLRLEHSVTSLHSKMPQWQRNHNLSQFRASSARILIATDVASRGLDIPSVNLVVNYDLPRNPDDYIHRVGRTARAGRRGTSITFVGPKDVDLLHAIEKRVHGEMVAWAEEGVNLETRLLRGRTMKDVLEARMAAFRDIEQNKDVSGKRRKVLKRPE
ncbi:MAG: hypothetical protein Q9227_001747 [Pyrenula ochraceoflavens]